LLAANVSQNGGPVPLASLAGKVKLLSSC
jgi:hypothetical protein